MEDAGTIVFKTDVDNEDLEEELKYAQDELKKLGTEADKLSQKKIDIEAQIDLDDKKFQEKINRLDAKQEMELRLKEDDSGNVAPEVESRINAKYDAQREEAEYRYGQKLEENKAKLEKINQAIQDNAKNQEAYKKQVDDTTKEIKEEAEEQEKARKNDSSARAIKGGIEGKIGKLGSAFSGISRKADMGGLSKKIDGIGKSVQGITRKVVKWGLAIFGIRSAYNMVRQAVSTISQQNEQVKNQIAIIKGALASALEPIVTRVVNLIYTLFSYINGIIKAITGKDLFGKARKNLEKGAKSSKEINKQLAGFDEANVLSDNSGGDSGFKMPEADSGMFKLLDEIKNLITSGDFAKLGEMLSTAIIGALTKVGDFIQNIDFTGLGTKLSDFLTHIDFSGILTSLVRVFGEAVLGLQNFILAIDFPTIFKNLVKGIADAFSKIGEYISQIKFADLGKRLSDTFTAVNWSEVGNEILRAIFEASKGIVDFVLAIDWSEVGETISTALHDWFNTMFALWEEIDWEQLAIDITDAIFDFFGSIDWAQLGLDMLYGQLKGLENGLTLITEFFGRLLSEILKLFGIASPSTVFEDMGINIIKGLVNGLKSIMESVVNVFKTIWTKITEVFSGVATWFRNKFKEAWNKIKEVFNGVGTFFGGIWNTIKSKFTEIGTKVGEVVGGAFKSVINGVLKAIETILNTPIKAVNKLIDVINAIPGINLGKLQTFSLPRLAKGGIINQPNKGVMVGSAVGGESGREGVIPLTDSQQMELLGEAIGRHVVINASVINTMNGRVISKELQRINNESDFAFNR